MKLNIGMKQLIFLVTLIGAGAIQMVAAQGSTLSTAEAADTLKRIFAKHISDELISSKVITEMFYADAPTLRIDSMYYEVYSLQNNYYVTIDHDISYMHNGRWNISVFRSMQSIILDSMTGADASFSFQQNPFSVYEEFINNPLLQFNYQASQQHDTARLTIVTTQPDYFNEIRLFYSKADGSLFRGEYIIPVPESDIPQQAAGDTSLSNQPSPLLNREYLMKMHYSYEQNTPTSGALFSETNFFIRNPDGTYSPSSHFPQFRVTRQGIHPEN